MKAPKIKISGKAFNVGVLNGNYTVKQIAEAAKSCLSINTKIVFNTEKIVDPRSYKVSFNRAKQELGFVAKTNLRSGGTELLKNILSINEEFQPESRITNRLTQLKYLIETKKIDKELRNL